MARRPTKTIVQPAQYELFAEVRARFADIGALGALSIGLTFAFCVPYLLVLLSMAEDHWFLPALMSVRWWVLAALVWSIAVEIGRTMRWIERKDFLATAHITSVAGVIALIVYILMQLSVVHEARAAQKAETAARAQAAADAKENARRTAEAECVKTRNADLENIAKQKAARRISLQRCKSEFEASQNFFSTQTVEQHCKTQYYLAAESERELKKVTDRDCSKITVNSAR